MMYTVDQIMQAIDALHETERKRLMREINRRKERDIQADVAPDRRTGELIVADYILLFSGGIKGNPGVGYGSFSILSADGNTQQVQHLRFDSVRPDEAAYDALIAGLEALLQEITRHGHDHAHCTVRVRGQSRLVIQQLQGLWKATDPRLAIRKEKALSLLRRFGSYKLEEVPYMSNISVSG